MKPKTRVFVVNDHSLVRRGLGAVIDAEADMRTCGMAASAATALDAIVQCLPDVVLVDVGRADNGAITLITRLKACRLPLRVIGLSLHKQAEDVRRKVPAGALSFVIRQGAAESIIAAVRRACAAKPRVGRLAEVDGGVDAAHRPARAAGAQCADRLDESERAIVALIGCGLPARSIAARLHLSVQTVETRRQQIRDKLNLADARELVQYCVQWAEKNGANSVPEGVFSGRRLRRLQGTTLKSSTVKGAAVPDERPKLVLI